MIERTQLHLVGIALGELASADPQRILEPDPDIAAHDRAHRDERQLVAAGGEDRPGVEVAEQFVGDPLHVDDILRIGADAAENAEDRLHKERRLDQPAIEEMRQVVEVADIVALELEPGAAALPQILQDALDIGEGVAEDEVARHLEMPRLPRVFEFLVALEQREQPEIHRAHIERAHFGLGAQRRREPLLERHAVAAAGRDVDDRRGRLLDPRQELHEHIGIRRRPPVLRVARMQMQDRRPRLRRGDRIARDLVRGQRQMRAHRRGMDRPGDGAGDDDLATQRHLLPPSGGRAARAGRRKSSCG